MNLLADNFIADMYGPHFLAFYAAVIVTTLLACAWRRRSADSTRHLAPMPLPGEPDPVETAYLRGGANEVTRLVTFDLVQRGFLRIVEPTKSWFRTAEPPTIARAQGTPPPRLLLPMETAVLTFHDVPHPPKDLFGAQSLASRMETLCVEIANRLKAERLLAEPGARLEAWRCGILGAAIILGLGGYKLAVALSKGRTNVGFLLILAILSMVALLLVCRTGRQSARGKDYLKRLQAAFKRLESQKTRMGLRGPDPGLLLLVSIFGLGTLQGTAHDAYRKLFLQGSSGGCGGGCGGGGGGCGGGGCGGGCGGCGG